ncbi:holin [Salmonella enterica subsp. enterica]|nr:holin [Salmonella enterica subsp. enterica serovar Kedougou]
MLTPHEKSVVTLATIGALIALGKVLNTAEPITLKLIIGRVILGSAASMVAGVALVQFPDLHPVAINGLGAAFGIVGYQGVELWLRNRAQPRNGSKKNDTE